MKNQIEQFFKKNLSRYFWIERTRMFLGNIVLKITNLLKKFHSVNINILHTHTWNINMDNLIKIYRVTLEKKKTNTYSFRKDSNIYKSSVANSKIFTIKTNGFVLSEQMCPTSGAVKLMWMNIQKQPLPVCSIWENKLQV